MIRLFCSIKVLVGGVLLMLGAGLVVAVLAAPASAQTGTGDSDAPACTGRASDPDSCKNLQRHGSPRTVLYVSTADQRRIDQLEAQLDRLGDVFDANENPSQADYDRYNREAARLVEQLNAIRARSGDAFGRLARVCDISPGVGQGVSYDGDTRWYADQIPLSRWYVCTPVTSDGEFILNSDDPFPGVGVSIQEYRLVSQRPRPDAERPTTPEPPLAGGQYTDQFLCETALGRDCRQVRRGSRSYWVATSRPRLRSDRTYADAVECGAIHGWCVSMTVERDRAGSAQRTEHFPASQNSEYLTAAQCSQYHRSCEMVQTNPNRANGPRRTVYVPTITGRVYTDSMQCGIDHGGCDEYHRDTDGDGVHDDTVYVPYPSTPVTTTITFYSEDGETPSTAPEATLTSRRVSVDGSNRRGPVRTDPDPEPTQPPTVPYGAVDVDGTGSPTQYDTGTECIKAGAGLCGLGDDGKWYRLQY